MPAKPDGDSWLPEEHNTARNGVPCPLGWHITVPREEVGGEEEFTVGDGLS